MISFRQVTNSVLIILIILFVALVYLDEDYQITLPYFNTNKISEKTTGLSHSKYDNQYDNQINNSTTGVTGKLFIGQKIRNYEFAKQFSNFHYNNEISNHKNKSNSCSYWGVVTTIFEPTDAMYKLLSLDNWCLVIVGDRKGPQIYNITTINTKYVYLNVSIQLNLINKYSFAKLLPWNHFGRKNLGYLYAVDHGASVIFDFDDDNILQNTLNQMIIPKLGNIENIIDNKIQIIEPMNVSLLSFNMYPIMGSPKPCWPRGYPLDKLKYNDLYNLQFVSLNISNIGVIQMLADNDPDVDAIYRLTLPLPFTFNTSNAVIKDNLLLIPQNKFAPFNAQATLFMYSSFWALLLPVSVHGRVSDIWRGYMYQKIARYVNQRLIFSPAMVTQYRNAHNYLADFDSELPLYKETYQLLTQLNQWEPSSKGLLLPSIIEELWIMMYERGYIELQDVELVQAWLISLIECNYIFPEVIYY